MQTKNSGTPSVLNIYSQTASTVKKQPLVLLPFVIFAIFEFAALILLFLAPRMPFIKFFGPPIRVFWGEQFLHYPANFLLLPKLLSLSKMFLAIFFGSLLTGMVVLMVGHIGKNQKIPLIKVVMSALKKYTALFTVLLIVTFLLYYGMKLYIRALSAYFMSGQERLLLLKPHVWLGPVLLLVNFIYTLLIQALFIYSIPFLMIEGQGLFKSLKKSFFLFKKFFKKTIILVGLPLLAYLPIVIIQMNSRFMINNVFPETILILCAAGIVLSTLIIDPIITISTALFFLSQKDK